MHRHPNHPGWINTEITDEPFLIRSSAIAAVRDLRDGTCAIYTDGDPITSCGFIAKGTIDDLLAIIDERSEPIAPLQMDGDVSGILPKTLKFLDILEQRRLEELRRIGTPPAHITSKENA